MNDCINGALASFAQTPSLALISKPFVRVNETEYFSSYEVLVISAAATAFRGSHSGRDRGVDKIFLCS